MRQFFDPSDEHKLLRDTIRSFTKSKVESQAITFDAQERFNIELFREAAELGILGITVAEELGGAGMDAVAATIVHEELSYSDPGFCLAYLAHAMLCVNNIAQNASSEQSLRWLPKLLTGEYIGAMGMSEPGAGTDVLGMKMSAQRDGDNYILNGRKMWITNGCVDDNGTPADLVLVYAVTGEKAGRPQLSSFVVEKGMSGYGVGQKITHKAGMRASNTAELVFDNCVVPLRNRIGEEGDSIRHMMRNLALERLTLAAMSVGIARRCVDVMSTYAADRKAFGKPISAFGQIQRYIANGYADMMAARTYVYGTASSMGLGDYGNRIDSDGVKLFASKMATRVAGDAIQVLGGYGYVGEYAVERLWRDAKLLEIGGGTVEAHEKNMTRDLAKLGVPWS